MNSSICPQCHQCFESPLYVLLWYGPAQEVWVNLGFSWLIVINWEDFWNWLGNCNMQDSQLTCWRFFITIWYLWYARNQYIMKGKNHMVRDICSKIENSVKELREFEGILPIQRCTKSPRWIPPKPLNVKLNFDAAYQQAQHQSCSGFVIRNERGQVMRCGVRRHRFVADAFAAKALACVQVVVFDKDMGFQNVKVEGDAKFVIVKLQNGIMDR